MAQSTDFIIASENARFGQPEAIVGLSAEGGSPALLPRLLPPGMAMEMLMTGEPISAQEAYRLGMINHVYPQANLKRAALETRSFSDGAVDRPRCEMHWTRHAGFALPEKPACYFEHRNNLAR